MDERDEEAMRRIAREGAQQTAAWVKYSTVTLFVSGVAWALWQGVRTALGK